MPRLVNRSPTVKVKRGARCQEGGDERFSQPSKQSLDGLVAITSLMTQKQNMADIAAVVLCPPAHSLQSPGTTPGKRGAGSRIQLLVGDASLDGGQCARVSLFVNNQSPSVLKSLLGVAGGQHVTTPSKSVQSGSGGNCGMLRKGDVVILSNMELRNVHPIQKSGEKRRHQNSTSVPVDGPEELGDGQLLKVVCDMSPSWAPSAHPSITRAFNADQRDGEGRDDALVPSNLSDELVSWYRKSILPKTYAPHRMIICQRRKLKDISSPNITSNVVVLVLRCERANDRWTPDKGTSSSVYLSHATLSDGPSSEDILGLTMCNQHSVLSKALSRTLMQALSEGSPVLLSNVTSQSMTANHGGGESLVLVPNTDTTAQIITRSHPYYPKERKRVENSSFSQPLTLERCSQLYSMTQQHSPSPLHGSTSNGCKGLVAVVASLTDFAVDGLDTSFMESEAWKDPRSLSNLLVDASSISTGMKAIDLRASYRSSTLTLDKESVSREIIVNADQDAMRLLCLDVPATELVISNEGENPYLGHLGDMLRALCAERAPIRWIIEQESERSWFVHSASLMKL